MTNKKLVDYLMNGGVSGRWFKYSQSTLSLESFESWIESKGKCYQITSIAVPKDDGDYEINAGIKFRELDQAVETPLADILNDFEVSVKKVKKIPVIPASRFSNCR